jgi:hypothetical protein
LQSNCFNHSFDLLFTANMSHSAVPSSVTDSVLQSSQPVPEGSQVVSGVDFDNFQGRDITVAEMVDNMARTGFQGSAVAEAASIINEMVIPPIISPLSSQLNTIFNIQFL